MENSNSTSNLKNKMQITQTSVLESLIGNKATSVRPTRSITPPRSLYRTGIKSTITQPLKDDNLLKKEE